MTTVVTADFPTRVGERTLGEMADELQVHLGKQDNDTVHNRCVIAIKNAIRRMNARLWNFNRVTQRITTIINDDTYKLNTNWRAAMSAKTLDSNNRPERPLAYVDYRYWKLITSSERIPGSTLLRFYTLRNAYRDGLFQVAPAASSVLKIDVQYYKLIPEPSGDSSHLDIPQFAEGVVYWKALHELHMSVNRDIQLSATARIEAEGAMREAVSADQLDSADWHIIED